MKNEHELKIINESIQAYENMIKFIRSQILDLHRKKESVQNDSCSECFIHKFEIASNDNE